MVGSPGSKLLADSDRQDPSEAQKRAYVIADNKLALNAGWDDALLKIELTELQALDFDLGMVAFAQGDLHPNSMALSLPDTKLLWGRAAARCSRDGCGRDLTRCNQGQHYILGEQAHVAGQSPAGPRPIQQGGPDTYENMILLCPTCHTEIDKKPDLFPKDMLLAWKKKHEEAVAAYGSEKHYASNDELTSAIKAILDENYVFFKEYGPTSDIAEANPSSNAYNVWEIGRAAKLVPNNLRILNMLKTNADLLTPEQKAAVPAFIAHAEGFAHHVHERLDHYPLFPAAFGKAFE